jgi:hypothetical protein
MEYFLNDQTENLQKTGAPAPERRIRLLQRIVQPLSVLFVVCQVRPFRHCLYSHVETPILCPKEPASGVLNSHPTPWQGLMQHDARRVAVKPIDSYR